MNTSGSLADSLGPAITVSYRFIKNAIPETETHPTDLIVAPLDNRFLLPCSSRDPLPSLQCTLRQNVRNEMSSSHHDGDDAGGGGTNPFDDLDFSNVHKRRERAKQAKATGGETMSAVEEQAAAPTEVVSKKMRRHNLVRAKSHHTKSSEYQDHHHRHNRKKASNFFGFGGGGGGIAEGNEHGDDEGMYEVGNVDMTPIRVGQRKVSIWPYDDYHVLQQHYYEKLQEEEEKVDSQQSKSEEKEQEQKSLPVMEQSSSIPIFSRPPDPPDIPTAVVGLSLTAFEKSAEERAISIVSTWLFDVGLIDELLVNGGMRGYRSQDGSAVGGTVDDDSKSVQTTSEGVEVSAAGMAIEGSSKMDKEIGILRSSTKRTLALINARLNDGVAVTGSEVQELVSAVAYTKNDIGRLRELSSYVSGADDTQQFMLTKYPKLKQAINARRNLARCFRELDFFAHIPATCDRLREELHAGEWTAHEWSSLRSVAREHVELELFLVQAEAGMKKRAGGSAGGKNATEDHNFNRFRGTGMNAGNQNALIDRFLEEHVSNVWELGDEIRLRIMSGISTAFDLALNNPAGMVALVEAVEVYEIANTKHKTKTETKGNEPAENSSTLRFTDMRAAGLAELYKDFETRGLDVFRELTMQAADVAEEEEASNKQFSAVLRASNELASEIGIVKDQMAPCFPDNWSITTLWTTCVAHVCSTNILQQIGGPDGQKLPDLTVTQLLDLVAWVENFREIIEETFPEIANMQAKRTYLNQSPNLLKENSKTIDLDAAQECLAWVNNTLWEVHDLAKDEFLLRTKEQTEGWLRNVYEYVPFLPFPLSPMLTHNSLPEPIIVKRKLPMDVSSPPCAKMCTRWPESNCAPFANALLASQKLWYKLLV